jgi:hypothetical protein
LVPETRSTDATPAGARQSPVRYGAAVAIGGLAGVSRLSATVPSLVAVVGAVAGAIVGLGVQSHEPVYHDAFAAAGAGTVPYAVVLILGALAGVYSMPGGEPGMGASAAGPFFEPMLFLPLFVVETLAVAVVVRRLRVWMVGEDTIECQ